MAYLPGYNLGCMDKSAEFVERMVIKLCATWMFLIWFTFPLQLSIKGFN